VVSHRDLSDVELRALAFVDERELVRDLVELVAVPSVSGSDAESDVQHLIAKQLRELDLDIDLWQLDLPRLTSDPAFPGWEATRSESWGLVASSGPVDGEVGGVFVDVPVAGPDTVAGEMVGPAFELRRQRLAFSCKCRGGISVE